MPSITVRISNQPVDILICEFKREEVSRGIIQIVCENAINLVSMTSTKPVALVVGASRGIGRQVAVDLGRNGYAGL